MVWTFKYLTCEISRLVLVIILFSPVWLLARNPIPHSAEMKFRHYSSDDGLPSDNINCSFKDSRGYMWFGTENGLSRFDGQSFKNFTRSGAAPHGHSQVAIRDIVEDQKGNLW